MNQQEEIRHLRSMFIKESQSLGSGLGSLVMNVDRNRDNKENLDRLFRAMHTLKSAAAAVPGAEAVSTIAHECESLLSEIREENRPWTDELLPLFLEATDKIIQAISDVAEGTDIPRDTSDIVERLRNPSDPGPSPIAEPEPVDPTPTTEGFHVPASDMEALHEGLGDLIRVRNQLQNLIKQDVVSGRPETPQLEGIGRALGHAIDDLSERLRDVQKVPLAEVTVRARRIALETSRSLKKQVRVAVTGDDQKIDRQVARSLGRAIDLLIRNACDHGIEESTQRLAAGKTPVGNLEIVFSTGKNGLTTIVEDDGQGIDTASIRSKLRSFPTYAARFHEASDVDVIEAVFLDGISTSKSVSSISGRGVGLPAARMEIARLGGTISVTSRWGQGCRFQIDVPNPRDESIVQVIIVKSGLMNFAIPVDRIVDVGQLETRDIAVADGRLTVQFRGRTLPLGTSSNWASTPAISPTQLPFETAGLLLVLARDGAWHGIRVDRVVDQIDASIQALSPFIRKMPGIRGTCLIPGNQLAFVVDPGEFIGGVRHG